MLVVGRKCHRQDPTRVPRKCGDKGAVISAKSDLEPFFSTKCCFVHLHVVYLHVSVVRTCQQSLRVGRECQGSDGHGVTFERMDGFALSHVNDRDDAVDGTAGYVLAVGRLCHKRRETATFWKPLLLHVITHVCDGKGELSSGV